MTKQESQNSKSEKLTDFGFTQVREDDKVNQVRQVFDEVAPKYDLMNDLLSFGLHRWWKRKTIDIADPRPGMRILDIAGGTGDLSLAFAKRIGNTGEIWLTDINGEMLKVGRKRLLQANVDIPVAKCDAENLPFPDETFDIITVAFGLRNMTHKDVALKEMCRVLKPNGKLLVLEFSKPQRWLTPIYDFYSFKFMPWLGKKIAGSSDDYRYLAESIRMHPDQETLAGIMSSSGFKRVEWINFNWGITALHMCYKNDN